MTANGLLMTRVGEDTSARERESGVTTRTVTLSDGDDTNVMVYPMAMDCTRSGSCDIQMIHVSMDML